jgi:uroporphyrinogen decarboxylase
MKLTVTGSIFEHVMENLLGFEGLFYLLHDEPDLVAQVFARWGQKVYELYESVIGIEQVGALFHADDLGFKTSTLLSPKDLRRFVFPWLKKYAALAHAHGKMFWLHCCGNIYSNGVIEDLIEDVQIDALHSFQDVILPVTDFQARFGNRVAELGGVVMDNTGNGHVGSAHGAKWTADGRRGGAMAFDGRSSCIESSDAGFPMGDATGAC